jgi:hypothetical protein
LLPDLRPKICREQTPLQRLSAWGGCRPLPLLHARHLFVLYFFWGFVVCVNISFSRLTR